MERKCEKCGVEEGLAPISYCGGKGWPKIVESRYGLLCERCAKNAYARQTTKTRAQSKRVAEHKRMIEDTGQMDMFADMEIE